MYKYRPWNPDKTMSCVCNDNCGCVKAVDTRIVEKITYAKNISRTHTADALGPRKTYYFVYRNIVIIVVVTAYYRIFGQRVRWLGTRIMSVVFSKSAIPILLSYMAAGIIIMCYNTVDLTRVSAKCLGLTTLNIRRVYIFYDDRVDRVLSFISLERFRYFERL